MQENNVTLISDVILLGFQNLQNFKSLFFSIFFLIYFATISGNVLIILLVSSSKNLHSPMYFFLTHLSLADILLSTDIAPQMLSTVLRGPITISFTSCISQFYFFAVSECSECLLLSVMSYDRFSAICNPLHYNSVMNSAFCVKLATMSWLLSFLIILIDTTTIALLQFCGPNVIDHFFCDYPLILELSCSDVFVVQLEVIFLSFPVLFVPFAIILVSYICILRVIFKISSITGKHKAFSTCSSHLTTVSVFYITLFCIYVLSTGQLLSTSKLLSLFYTVGTPLINPIIYSLRNKDIKESFRKLMNRAWPLYKTG
ncbi:olfactory receptor 11L1-like [Bufo bufo]|uniref:olfactory receptor 11L1-like n=1 Tax=Bufo bufo TaxID=8384 RepID=UPI001ABDAB0B|nr:olfactory receptor 11L1-like [Bufo bufo]